MVNRSVIKARLIDIIIIVIDEMKKHPTVWSPVRDLRELLSNIEEYNEKKVLIKIGEIEYRMIDQYYSYKDIVMAIVMKFCSDISFIIILNHALSFITRQNDPVNTKAMKLLLHDWISKFPQNGDIPHDIEIRYSNEFVRLYNIIAEYWAEVFPGYLIELLSKFSEPELSKRE